MPSSTSAACISITANRITISAERVAKTMNGQPRAYKIASVQATKELEQLFTDATQILENKLDNVMKIFKRRDANFYNGYIAAREVVDN